MRVDCGICVVRDWRRDDKESLLRHADNRNVWRNLSHRFPHPYTGADAEAWFAFLDGNDPRTHWAIEVEGAAVGGIGVIIGEGIYAQSGHFGYWLGQSCWGRSIATAAAGVMAEYIFSNFDLVRLEAPVFQWNPASMRVLEKCGFTREGILRKAALKDGQQVDCVLYARVR